MEISNFEVHGEHETIDKRMQASSLLSFDLPLVSGKDWKDEGAERGSPHEALFLVLAYLPVFELLAMGKVCKALRDSVANDVLPWLDIIIDRPLNSRLSDEILMKITSKANGRLRTLALINCFKITDDGLQRVIEKNPFISKLHIPGCIGLTPEGIIRNVKTLSQQDHSRLKSLWINGIYNLKKEHLETLWCYLQANQKQRQPHLVLYHHFRASAPSINREMGCIIDVEICPKCNEVRMVFDCSRDYCKRKEEKSFRCCKGCNFCIPRCEECGGCVGSEELEHAICADALCSACWLRLPKCNHCNQPYCKRHADQQCSSPGSAGFVCDVCQVN